MSQRVLLIEQDMDTRWGDMDALGHVNNAVYFTYIETVRVLWLERIGGRMGEADGEGPVLAQASCDYLRPVFHPTRLRVFMYGGVPGNSSLPTDYEIADADDPSIIYARASARIVWVNYAAGKPRRLPDTFRALLPGNG